MDYPARRTKKKILFSQFRSLCSLCCVSYVDLFTSLSSNNNVTSTNKRTNTTLTVGKSITHLITPHWTFPSVHQPYRALYISNKSMSTIQDYIFYLPVLSHCWAKASHNPFHVICSFLFIGLIGINNIATVQKLLKLMSSYA